MSRNTLLFFLFSIIACFSITQAQNYPWVPNKKVLFATQGGPNPVGPAWVKTNLATVEASPFDGLFISTSSQFAGVLERNCSLFNPNWTDLDSVSLAGVQWTKCKHNFFTIFSSDDGTFKWFDNTQWATALKNGRKVARAAKAANFAGVYWDTEPYMQVCPWEVSAKLDGHTEAELRARVRLCGGQMMSAFQKEFPGLKLFTTLLVSAMPTLGTKYGLVPDWLNGLLDSIQGNTRIIDGDEIGFYYNNTADWFDRYQLFRTSWRSYCKPENLSKYDTYYQKSNMVYDAQITSTQEWEHNTYVSMMTGDEYALVYVEGFRWFNNVTPVVDAAVRSAITKYNSAQRLGYDQTGQAFGASSSNSAVTVNITSPKDGTKFPASTSIPVTATASGGTIVTAILYKNVLKVTSDNSSPYEWNLSSLPDGYYTFVVRANNSAGQIGTSNPVNITVGNPPPKIIQTLFMPMAPQNISIKKSINGLAVYVPFAGTHALRILDISGRQISSIPTSGIARWYEVLFTQDMGSSLKIISVESDGNFYASRLLILR